MIPEVVGTDDVVEENWNPSFASLLVSMLDEKRLPNLAPEKENESMADPVSRKISSPFLSIEVLTCSCLVWMTDNIACRTQNVREQELVVNAYTTQCLAHGMCCLDCLV